MNQRQKREFVFQQLFIGDFYEAGEVAAQLNLFLEDEDLLEELREEALSLPDEAEKDENLASLSRRASAILAIRSELDEKIDAVATGWRTGRMGRVELALLRLALYEMEYDDSVPYRVAINEAVELAKKYGGDDAPSFINAILGKLARTQEENE
ncbi:MAG: transcription antitermination factor NusB [Lachnospiraceae bacterium]|nr:transcription antitermination factor NusB [Lachnospiraceae bacterium]